MRMTILLAGLTFVACGGSGGGQPAILMVNLTAAGASSTAISIGNGGQLQFVNQDTADHQIASTNCAELNSPRLTTGKSFTTTLNGGPKSCSFDDALNPGSAAFSGTVTVTASPAPPGY